MLLIDDISKSERTWLLNLAHMYRRARIVSFLPAAVFETFKEKKWVEGSPDACVLTEEGYSAAHRLFSSEELYKGREAKQKEPSKLVVRNGSV